MSYENMIQTTTELYNSLERVMAMATAEHGMIGFSVGVTREENTEPHGDLLIVVYNMHGHGREMWQAWTLDLQCYRAEDMHKMDQFLIHTISATLLSIILHHPWLITSSSFPLPLLDLPLVLRTRTQ